MCTALLTVLLCPGSTLFYINLALYVDSQHQYNKIPYKIHLLNFVVSNKKICSVNIHVHMNALNNKHLTLFKLALYKTCKYFDIIFCYIKKKTHSLAIKTQVPNF